MTFSLSGHLMPQELSKYTLKGFWAIIFSWAMPNPSALENFRIKYLCSKPPNICVLQAGYMRGEKET